MSTLKVDTLQTTGGAGLYPAKVWSAWNQVGTQSIRGSGNISSITDGGVGITTNNFSNSLSSSNFSVTFGCGGSSTDPYRYIGAYVTMTTSTVKTISLHTTTAAYDTAYNAIQIIL